MKILKLLFQIALLLVASQAYTQNDQRLADKITGIYWSPKKDAKIEIYKKGDQYFGKSIWVAVPKKDTNNPDVRLQLRDVSGIELLSGFSYSDGIYKEGEIYDPESGKTYDCKIKMTGGDLKVRGYIGLSVFGRTEIFERIK